MNPILVDLGFAVLFVVMLVLLLAGLVYFENRAVSHHRRVIRRAVAEGVKK